MAEHRLTTSPLNFLCVLLLGVVMATLSACSAETKAARSDERLIKENIPRTPSWNTDVKPPVAEPAPPPPFASMTEEIVPLKTKVVNIVVRNSSLGDVLHVMAEASGLNLLIDRDVYLDQPVTLSLRNVLAEDALKIIFSNLDCFYTIENNVLRVDAMGTKVFELGHPALVNTYSMSVGGDILAAGGSASGLKGSITSGNSADAKAFDFWGSLEKSLESIMGKPETQAPAAAKAADAKAADGKPLAQGQQTKQTTVTSTSSDDSATSTSVSVSSGTSTSSRYGRSRQQQNITINRLTGTIMVTANRQSMDKVERYLANVRKVLGRQVIIEARIIEVQLNESLKFGIDWSVVEQNAVGVGSLMSGFGAANAGTSTLQALSTAASASKQFQFGVGNGNFQAMLTALQSQGTVRVLSNPKINVMNGHASILTVGNNTSFISKVTATTTTTAAGPTTVFTPEISSVLSGMIIGVIPYISESGEISLNITPITSDMSTTETTIGAGTATETKITIPTVALREMTTTVKMRDGQMAVIGGLISRKENLSDDKVPVLGDIPLLGRLFTRTNNTDNRTELVLLLRPRIVDNE